MQPTAVRPRHTSPEERKRLREGVPWICVAPAGEYGEDICGNGGFRTIEPGEIWECTRCGAKTFRPGVAVHEEPVDVLQVKRVAGRAGEKKARRSAHSKGYVKRGVASWWRGEA